MKRNAFLFFIVFAGYFINSCGQTTNNNTMKNDDDNEPKIGWQPNISAPAEFPMETYYLAFSNKDSTGGNMMSLTARLGWGEGDGRSDLSIPTIPYKMDICWLSYAENQFWEGSFKLPYDTMAALFKKGFPDVIYDDATKKDKSITATYDVILVGMAPGGVVVVWLAGAGTERLHQVEVARFQAAKTTIDMKKFLEGTGGNTDQAWLKDNDAQKGYSDYEMKRLLSDSVREKIAKEGIPYGLWDRYRERFNWRPQIEANPVEAGPPSILKDVDVHFYNGEWLHWDSAEIASKEYKSEARIRNIKFDWYSPEGVYYGTGIQMNENEIFWAYQQIFDSSNADKKAELIIQTSRLNDQITLYLEHGSKRVKLTKAIISTSRYDEK